MVDSFLGWLGPSSSSTTFTLCSEGEDESSTGSERDGVGWGWGGLGGRRALFDRQSDHFGFGCRLAVTAAIQRELVGVKQAFKD